MTKKFKVYIPSITSLGDRRAKGKTVTVFSLDYKKAIKAAYNKIERNRKKNLDILCYTTQGAKVRLG